MPDPSKETAPVRPSGKARPAERRDHADAHFPASIKVDPWPTGRPSSQPPKKAGK